MITKLVPIGTSKGIRLPKAILQQCGIVDELELEVKDSIIILQPIKKKAIDRWIFEGSAELTKEDKEWLDASNDFDIDEWEWK